MLFHYQGETFRVYDARNENGNIEIVIEIEKTGIGTGMTYSL